MDCRADCTATDRGIAGTVVAGDEQDDALAASDRLVEAAIDGSPGGVEAHTMEIDNPVWLDRADAQAPVPAAVQGVTGRRPWLRRSGGPGLRRRSGYSGCRFSKWLSSLGLRLFTREWLDR